MATIYDLSWARTSFIAKLILFFRANFTQRRKIKSVDIFTKAAGYSALSSIYAYMLPELSFAHWLVVVNVFLALPSILEWNIINSAFRIYLLAINAALIFSIYRRNLLK